MKYKDYIAAILISAIVTTVGFTATNRNVEESVPLGADTVKTIGGQVYTLAGGGISSSATSITLTSLTIPQTGYEIQDSDLSDTFYLTIEPGSRSRQEFVSCTTVSQSSTDTTATLSGCSRGLLPFTPYTASTTYAFAHSGGTSAIFSDPPQLYNQAAFKDNDETVTGAWNFPTPTGGSHAATKDYVDGLVNGGTVSYDQIIVSGTGGATLATTTLVYFDGSDQEWKKVDVDDTSTFQDKFIGLTQGPGTDGGAITNGVLLKGLDTNVTGLTPGSTYYASTSAGDIHTTQTIQPIGIADDTDRLYFDPVLIEIPRLGYDNVFTGDNTFSSTGTTTISATSTAIIGAFPAWEIGKQFQVLTTVGTSTFSVPSGINKLWVEVLGAGGGGGACSVASSKSGAGGGGGAGGWAIEMVDVTGTSTIQYVVGAAGAAGTTASSTKFGYDGAIFLSAEGGVGGSEGNGAAGGTASSGDLNIQGAYGDTGEVESDNTNNGAATGGTGGHSRYGSGGRGATNIPNSGATAGAAATGYGGGGGGAACGASGSAAGGAGAQGLIIVRW